MYGKGDRDGTLQVPEFDEQDRLADAPVLLSLLDQLANPIL